MASIVGNFLVGGGPPEPDVTPVGQNQYADTQGRGRVIRLDEREWQGVTIFGTRCIVRSTLAEAYREMVEQYEREQPDQG